MAPEPKLRPEASGLAELLRPALELSWQVAKLGLEATPSLPPPGALRPLLRFSRLPARALATLQKVVDDDSDFRHRVAEAAAEVEETLGRGSWLWLTRPPGWEEELAEVRQGVETHKARSAATQGEEALERRLANEASARTKAERAAVEGAAKANDLLRQLRSERQIVRELRNKLSESHRSAEEAERAAVRDRREAESHERTVAELRRQCARLEADLVGARADLERARSETASPGPGGPDDRGSAPGQDPVGLDPISVASVREAARRARELSDSLGVLAESLVPRSPAVRSAAPEGVARSHTPAPLHAGAAVRASLGTDVAAKAPKATRAKRVDRLPPAVFDDSPEAAEHLVRVPRTLVVVDGYNVSFAGWPELPIMHQRGRLVDAMAELSARIGTEIHVVFDGGEPHDQLLGARPGPRQPVKVTFSPPGVDADEVIIDMARSLAHQRPVLVATSDRRVRESVEGSGASVISAVQLLGVAGRGVRRWTRGA